MRENLQIKLYPRNPTSTTLQDDLSGRVQCMRFSTKLHGGFDICSFRLRADLPESWEWISKRIFFRLVVSEGQKTLWEGRIEDVNLNESGVSVTAYGYWSHLSDQPYHTAYNAHADDVIKAALTAACPYISADQSNIAATDITITSGAEASYLDITVQELVKRLLEFSDSTNSKWYFAIWESRIAWLVKRTVGLLNWQVNLADFKSFQLSYRAGDMWNSCYVCYQAGGALTRTADADDADSQTKYVFKRQYVIPDVGAVAAAAAQSYRDGWLNDHKEIWPKLTNMILGNTVYDVNGKPYPSYWVRAGQVIRVQDLVPASVDAGSVTRDRYRTYYIVQTDYDVDRAQLTIVPDTESTKLSSVLARKL